MSPCDSRDQVFEKQVGLCVDCLKLGRWVPITRQRCAIETLGSTAASRARGNPGFNNLDRSVVPRAAHPTRGEPQSGNSGVVLSRERRLPDLRNIVPRAGGRVWPGFDPARS